MGLDGVGEYKPDTHKGAAGEVAASLSVAVVCVCGGPVWRYPGRGVERSWS